MPFQNEQFSELYKKNFQMVYKICYIYMKNAQDAEDCTEDTFVRALNSDINFNDENHEKAWLTVTAKNICKDKLKHWWKRKTEPIDDYAETLSGGGDVHNELLDAVIKLPAKYKDVIILYYYIGYQTDEIAKLLKKPASTIRNQLRDARQKLKEKLGGDFSE